MAKKSDVPNAPDYSGLISAATNLAGNEQGLANQQQQWAKDTYGNNLNTSNNVVGSDLGVAGAENAAGNQNQGFYTNTTMPLMQAQADEAQKYNNPAFRDQQMGAAGAAVGQSFDAARDNATRDLESYGVDPSSTRFAALDVGTRAQQAAATVSAENQAGLQTDATGRALTAQAVNTGQVAEGQAGANYGTALQGGAGAINTALGTTASGANTMGTGTQYSALQNSALQGAGALQNTSFQNQNTQWQDQFKSDQALGQGIQYGVNKVTSLFAAGGGAIPDPSGAVPASASPSGGRAVDDVKTMLTPGEFVVPHDVVSWMGEKHFQDTIQKARVAKQQAAAKPAIGVARAQPATYQSRQPQGAI